MLHPKKLYFYCILLFLPLLASCDDTPSFPKAENGDIWGLPVKYVNLDKDYFCKKNNSGSNHNLKCQSKQVDTLEGRYYLKKYEIYYFMDSLHNKAFLDFVGFDYPQITIWVDPKKGPFIASKYYYDFQTAHIKANGNEYAIDIAFNDQQKTDYLSLFFMIGDVHTDNVGTSGDQLVVIDYDWPFKDSLHYASYPYDFLMGYVFEEKYLFIKAKDFVKTGENLEFLFKDKKRKESLKKDLTQLYGRCEQKQDYKVNVFSLVEKNILNTAKCLKSFAHQKTDTALLAGNVEYSCLNPEYSNYLPQSDAINKIENKFFDDCYLQFEKEFREKFAFEEPKKAEEPKEKDT